MAIKHYIYSGCEYHTTVLGKRKSFRVHFEPSPEGAICVTGNREEQAAIEGDPRFNRLFSLCMSEQEPETEEPPEAMPQEKKETVCRQEELQPQAVEEVENISQAREYLKRQGISGNALRTPEAILRQARQAGIGFPHLILTDPREK